MAEKDDTSGRSSRSFLGTVLLMTVLGFCWASVLSYSPFDWPAGAAWPGADPVSNACGPAGAWVAYQLFFYLGRATYPLLVFLSGFGVAWVAGRVPADPLLRAIGTALLVAAAAAGLSLLARDIGTMPNASAGGVVGISLADLLAKSFNRLGAVLLVLATICVGLILAADEVVLRALEAVRAAALRAHWPVPARLVIGRAAGEGSPEAPRKGWFERFRLWPGRGGAVLDEDGDEVATEDVPVTAARAETIAEVDQGEPDVARRMRSRSRRSAKQASPANRRAVATWPTELKNFELPPLDLLADPEPVDQTKHDRQVQTKAKTLEQTLREFRIDAKVVQIDTGPVITIYELDLAPGVKVSQITSLSNDIARVLRAPMVRVVAPIPGKNTVGIEVPNLCKERVRLKELLGEAPEAVRKMALPLFIGKDASGRPLVADLAVMPHMLIAGTTGSGKSVCINSLITSLLMTQRPDHVKLILVDPKMVELSGFAEIPHLMCPIVTDMQQASMILDWATQKMDERYELLAEAGVRDLAGYNRLSKSELYERFQPGSDEERGRIPLHLPHIVIIIDELSDLMMTSGKEVEFCLSRLAQKSRAVGIHIILATQRPQANVVTGLIKSNLPCRIAFRVASRMDSRIVLDQNGAEVLMGQGDMLFLPPGSSKLIRAQGTFVDDAELRRVVEYLKSKAPQEFHEELIHLRKKDEQETAGRDPLFDEAVQIVLETQRGSVSLLQRRLMIGYGRAARLIDQMAEAGIVGAYKGSQAREVLVTLEEWEQYRNQRPRIEADEAHDREIFEDEPEPAQEDL